MKQLVVLFGCAVFLSALVGCQGPSGKSAKQGKIVLPPEVAGIWKAYDSPWVIELSPDGKVVSAVIPMGEVEVRPNKTTKVEMLDGSISTYKAGDCIVEYDPATRQLFVSIEVKEIHIRFVDERIDGHTLDMFTGEVSPDGKLWTPNWAFVFDYGPRFPQDPNDYLYPQPVSFEKVEK